MEYVISRHHNQDISWVGQYAPTMILYDRSDDPLPGANVVANIGTDIFDKFTYIIEKYDNLPPVMLLAKANLFKYITPEEFELVKNNSFFTPLLTMYHETKEDVSYYENGIYWEVNNKWYLGAHPTKYDPDMIMREMGIDKLKYIPFAPGSNYIVTRQNVMKKPKEWYIKMRDYLGWAVYPGEAQIVERGLYTIWK